MKKRTLYAELAYALGVLLLALATALMERGGLGMSIVVAPAYVVHLKLAETFAFFTFGMAEYLLQALVLALLFIILRRVRVAWLLTFGTTLLYGLALDGMMALTAYLPTDTLWWRCGWYVLGFLLCAVAVSFLMCTYLPPAAYELFVKELTVKIGRPFAVVKTVYDCVSLVVAVVLSFCFFGALRGVGIGTVVGALFNGVLIRWCSRGLNRLFTLQDRFPWRRWFA